jgi:A nuclease of the HNH/ENDO VII superfamily with conserved LHH
VLTKDEQEDLRDSAMARSMGLAASPGGHAPVWVTTALLQDELSQASAADRNGAQAAEPESTNDSWQPRGSLRHVAFREGPMGPPMDSYEGRDYAGRRYQVTGEYGVVRPTDEVKDIRELDRMSVTGSRSDAIAREEQNIQTRLYRDSPIRTTVQAMDAQAATEAYSGIDDPAYYSNTGSVPSGIASTIGEVATSPAGADGLRIGPTWERRDLVYGNPQQDLRPLDPIAERAQEEANRRFINGLDIQIAGPMLGGWAAGAQAAGASSSVVEGLLESQSGLFSPLPLNRTLGGGGLARSQTNGRYNPQLPAPVFMPSIGTPLSGPWSATSNLTPRRGVVQFQGLEVRAVRDLNHISVGQLRDMQKYGFAPNDINGDPLILHHHLQNPAGPVIEIPARYHNIYNSNQHPFANTRGLGLTSEERAQFNNWRTGYWRWRATEELALRGLK